MRVILFRGKRVDNSEWVYGFYWFIESHRDEKLSGKHFIKSINNGIDYDELGKKHCSNCGQKLDWSEND